MHHLEGDYHAKGHRYGLVVSRFNLPITEKLLAGAIDALKRHGVKETDLTVAWVPGAFELPLIAQTMAKTGRFDAILCIGAVIRGETPHFDLVAGQSAAGSLRVGLETEIPVIFSVLTTDTKEQAEVRAGSKGTNSGFSYALSAIEMVNLKKRLSE